MSLDNLRKTDHKQYSIECEKRNYLCNIKIVHDLPYFGSKTPIEATCNYFFLY
jgi:hypothetical protein